MRLSTRSRYGLRFMLELALNYGKGPTYLKEVAVREGISEKYLSQLVIPLKSANLIGSVRGAHGGYVLKRAPSEITVREVVEVLEGDLNLVPCVEDPSLCERVSICVTRNIWSRLGKSIIESLESLKLEDLVKMQKEKERINVMYNI